MAKSRYAKGQEPYEKPPTDKPLPTPQRTISFDADIPGSIGRSTRHWNDEQKQAAAQFVVDNWPYLVDLIADIATMWATGRCAHAFGLDELVAFLDANGWEIDDSEKKE